MAASLYTPLAASSLALAIATTGATIGATAGPAAADTPPAKRAPAADEPATPDAIPWPAPKSARDRRTQPEFAYHMSQADRLAQRSAQLRSRTPTLPSRRLRDEHEYEKLATRAVAEYERAAEIAPDRPEPHFRAAELMYYTFYLTGDEVIRDREGAERTLAHWTAFERLAPLDPRVRNTLFSRALLHTKLATEADFWHAIGYYEKLLSRSDLDTSLSENVATWLGNLAETYMMVGELEKAVATYGRALEFQNRALYAFGLGVALDRLGHGAKARELVGNYATNGGIDALIADNIFFVPYGELYYYQALAYEALGEYDTAIVKYRQFIASGAHPRYQPRAVENLQRVLATRKAKGPTIRLPRKGFVF